MIGLLRGFAVNVVDAQEEMGELLIATINQAGQASSRVRATAKSLAEQVLVSLDRMAAARLDGAEVH